MTKNENTNRDIAKAKQKLKELQGKTLVSKDGIEAIISSKTLGKMVYGLENTLKNGFSAEEHFDVVSKIDEIFPNAVKVLEHNSRKEGDSAKIIRLCAPISKNYCAVVYITAREFIDLREQKCRMHAIELVKIERLGETIEAAANSTNYPSPTLYPNNIIYLQEKVKGEAEI
ncbi:MAG: hypothetical protein FWE23_06125 [Chitinivibrionia bacterium]|nr:hypothetical protein [Chitinivibrionia bacterium]